MIPAEDLQDLLHEMDDNGDGKIDYGVSILNKASIWPLCFTGVYNWNGKEFDWTWRQKNVEGIVPVSEISIFQFYFLIQEAFRVFDNTGEGIVTRKYLKLSILNSGNSSLQEVTCQSY